MLHEGVSTPELDMHGMPAGYYMIALTTEGGTIARKAILLG